MSRQTKRERSRSRTPQAGDFALVEQFDGFSGLRNGLRRAAAERLDWAGIPMPLSDQKLIIHPKFPNGLALSMIGAPEEKPLPAGVKLRNSWWSDKLRAQVYVYEEDGKILGATLPHGNNLAMAFNTMACSVAWGVEQEGNAVQTLGTLISHFQFKSYLLTGMFVERSKRSGLTYLFRRLRPTVAIDARSESDKESARILCVLCLHPIAYYDGTWAGAMCPTDDVIAHLMLMRGDEHMFWKRSNQHAPGRPEAGL